MTYFTDIINEIEENITNNIDVAKLAQKANMSVYEFRRIFTFITRVSFSEYIRRRRMSLAALELFEGNKTVAELADKYGYDAPSSFTRAFKDFHGIPPAEVMKGNNNFNLFTKINTQLITTGGKDISYTIFNKDSFTVSGFKGKSDMNDTECCEDVWSKFYELGFDDKICKNADRIYAVYDNGNDFVDCCIGVIGEEFEDKIYIPSTDWVCFKLVGNDDDYVNSFYQDVINQWLASSGYSKNNTIPNVEVFPSDMSEDGFEWEIWIPVKKGGN